MLAQFQARYPTGSLISELLQIYEGKYIVRASVQIEGITRATGMAAAETLELAEDRARSRALIVMGIQPVHLEPVAVSDLSQTDPLETLPPREPELSYLTPGQPLDNLVATPNATPNKFNDSPDPLPLPALASSPASSGLKGKKERFSLAPTPTAQEPDTSLENFGTTSTIPTVSSTPPSGSFSNNVTPLVPRSHTAQTSISHLNEIDTETGIPTPEKVPEKADLSDAIARTSVELKRLGWSNQQGREYLERTYGKRSRQQLSDEEMLEFLEYLESQPTPNDPFT